MDPIEIVTERMYAHDAFSQWLGIQVLEVAPHFCQLSMVVRLDMLNGFGIAHGGISYALADSALAFASNAVGRQAVSVETSISHTGKVVAGDVLTAKTEILSSSRRFAIYLISITNQDDKRIASFKGTVYYTGKDWE